MSEELHFEPFSWVSCPHRQTLIGAFFNFLFEPSSKQKLVRLPDGDIISLEITTPNGWKETDPTVMLVHGLCGSHKAPNLSRMARKLEAIGIRAVRMNMRGCGSGKGLARDMYHSGRCEDIFDCIKAIKNEHPLSDITLIGFSLGGNMTLKLVGELGSIASTFLKSAIAVSPPCELAKCVERISSVENQRYERYFYKELRADVHYRHKKFKELPPLELPETMRLAEFDRIYTAPMYGFKDSQDYYDKCSSANVVEEIAIPCKILFSEDDPLVYPHSLDQLHLPSNVSVYKTKKGGHMGYIGRTGGKRGFYWLDSVLVDWITES